MPKPFEIIELKELKELLGNLILSTESAIIEFTAKAESADSDIKTLISSYKTRLIWCSESLIEIGDDLERIIDFDPALDLLEDIKNLKNKRGLAE